jgi:hypothetical protein
VTDLTDKPPENKEKPEIPASELDDESLIDRVFPNEVIDWVKDLFGKDEEE